MAAYRLHLRSCAGPICSKTCGRTRKGKARGLGSGVEASATIRQVFELWHRYQEGRFGRAELRRRMHSLERRFGCLLRKGLLCPEGKTAKYCANVLRFEESLWTFVRREGLELTNNLAERILRSLVLWRKISVGCDSEKGFRFVEPVLTVTQTLNLQSKVVFQFVCDAVTALRNGKTVPSLAWAANGYKTSFY